MAKRMLTDVTRQLASSLPIILGGGRKSGIESRLSVALLFDKGFFDNVITTDY